MSECCFREFTFKAVYFIICTFPNPINSRWIQSSSYFVSCLSHFKSEIRLVTEAKWIANAVLWRILRYPLSSGITKPKSCLAPNLLHLLSQCCCVKVVEMVKKREQWFDRPCLSLLLLCCYKFRLLLKLFAKPLLSSLVRFLDSVYFFPP